MSYRDRRLERANRLREWAEKRARKAEGGFTRAHNLIKDIPLGQPILVGHHSERRHRRTLEKSDNAMRSAVENQKTADDMAFRAASIEAAADSSIYMDDHDAIDRLTAKITELEAKRDQMKAQNVAFRKGDPAYAALMGITVEQAAGIRSKIMSDHSWLRQPFPTYSLQNIGGTINKEKKRLAQLKAAKTSTGTAVTNPAGLTATARSGLTITATMTTPAKSWKQPRPVWNVSGNLAYWRPILVDELAGTFYHGVVSFWDDPTEDIETAVKVRLYHLDHGIEGKDGTNG